MTDRQHVRRRRVLDDAEVGLEHRLGGLRRQERELCRVRLRVRCGTSRRYGVCRAGVPRGLGGLGGGLPPELPLAFLVPALCTVVVVPSVPA